MAYNSNVIKYAEEVQRKYNVPASVTLAAYTLESGRGTSVLAQKYNNYFGITQTGTAGSVTLGGRKWAKYNSMQESFDSFGKLMSSPLYANKTRNAKNIDEYVKAYAETYAPSSDGNNNYAQNILNIIRQENLTKYDKENLKNKISDGFLSKQEKKTRPDLEVSTPEQMKEDRGDWGADLLRKIFVLVSSILLIILSFLFISKALSIDKKGVTNETTI
jgi:muramidase (flagellum-specific)